MRREVTKKLDAVIKEREERRTEKNTGIRIRTQEEEKGRDERAGGSQNEPRYEEEEARVKKRIGWGNSDDSTERTLQQ